MKLYVSFLAASFVAMPFFADASMIDSDLHDLIQRCAPAIKADQKVAVGLIKTESAGNPLAIGINSKAVKLKRQPKTLMEAVEVAVWLAKNRYSFDAGIAQININNINKFIDGDVDFRMRKIFDPCHNLGVAEKIFNSCLVSTGSVAGALSCYNTGNAKDGIKNGYVAKVFAKIPELLDVRELRPESSNGVRVERQSGSSSAAKKEIATKDGMAKSPKKKNGDVFSSSSRDVSNVGDVFSECVDGENQKCDNE